MGRRSGVASHYGSDKFKMSNADEFQDAAHSGKGAGNYLEKDARLAAEIADIKKKRKVFENVCVYIIITYRLDKRWSPFTRAHRTYQSHGTPRICWNHDHFS